MKLTSTLLFSVLADVHAKAEIRTRGLRGKLDPDWWRATTPPPSTGQAVYVPGIFPYPTAPGAATFVNATAAAAAGLASSPDITDVRLQMCTEFVDVSGTFVATAEYWAQECKSIPSDATFIKMVVGDVVDFFKPVEGHTMCEMLTSSDKHLWSNNGKAWVAPVANAGANGLGGSAEHWLSEVLKAAGVQNDNRDVPSFWGNLVKSTNNSAGACCHSDYSAGDLDRGWGKSFKMEYCGVPKVLAPVCKPVATVSEAMTADKDFWTDKCNPIPLSTTFVKVAMGNIIDYFKPPAGQSYCQMLTSNQNHKWSATGDKGTWVEPTYDTTGTELGGGDVGNEDERSKVSSWGNTDQTKHGGCCYSSQDDPNPGSGKSFTLSYCEIPQLTPMSELVQTMHETEEQVVSMEKSVHGLHDRLHSAEMVNVDASGNVSLARSGMFKLAAKAANEADELSTLQKRTSLASTNLDQSESELQAAEKRLHQDVSSLQPAVEVAKEHGTEEDLKDQEELNERMFKLLDPTNPEGIDKIEQGVGAMEKEYATFRKELSGQIRTVMMTKMRKSVQGLRKMLHRLGNVGRKSEEGLGETESSAPLGADLGLNDYAD